MPHPLELEYGLSAEELLDAINKRFRAKVTLEGAVAEVKVGKILQNLQSIRFIQKFEQHDLDGYPDYSIQIAGRKKKLRLECKNIRDSDEAYRKNGEVIAYKVETQKTRASRGDASSRFYGYDQFEILAVCLGKKTKNWSDFLFIRTNRLDRHPKYPKKLATMQRVPLPASSNLGHWSAELTKILKSFQ